MSESYKPGVEGGVSSEQLKLALDICLEEVRNAAAAVGQYETGRSEVDLGMAESLKEKIAAAKVASDRLIDALAEEGEKAGIATRQGDLLS